MPGSKRNPKADDEARKAIARARKLFAGSGIDCTAPIHCEDAARFMVEFAVPEKELSEQMRAARKVIEDNHDALRTLAGS
jgi:hypothetical protein